MQRKAATDAACGRVNAQKTGVTIQTGTKAAAQKDACCAGGNVKGAGKIPELK